MKIDLTKAIKRWILKEIIAFSDVEALNPGEKAIKRGNLASFIAMCLDDLKNPLKKAIKSRRIHLVYSYGFSKT